MTSKAILLTTLVGLVIGVVSYLFIPMLESDMKIWATVAIGSFLGSLIITIISSQKPYLVGVYFTLGVVLFIIARIIYDVELVETKSHNLAGLEVMVAVILSLPTAILGAYLGRLLRKLKK